MKILITGRNFHKMAGGVERQAISILNALAERGYECHLLTRDRQGAVPFYPIDPRVQWHKLGVDPATQGRWSKRLGRLSNMRKLLHRLRPDLVLGFQHGPFFLAQLGALGSRLTGKPIRVVACERVSPYQYEFVNGGRAQRWIDTTYRLAHRITVQCPSYVEAYPAFLRSKLRVIPNAVQPAASQAKPEQTADGTWRILSVGRICDQKNQAVLLEAFARLSPRFPNWRLQIVGDGEDMADRKTQADALGIAAHVDFEGAQKDVPAYYAAAHVFAFPSKWEGFPNALAEAMAHGLPVLGYQGCAGTRDLIQSDENGLLVQGNGDLDSLTQGLEALMRDQQRRARLGQQARASMQAYAPAAVMDLWEEFFAETLGSKGPSA